MRLVAYAIEQPGHQTQHKDLPEKRGIIGVFMGVPTNGLGINPPVSRRNLLRLSI